MAREVMLLRTSSQQCKARTVGWGRCAWVNGDVCCLERQPGGSAREHGGMGSCWVQLLNMCMPPCMHGTASQLFNSPPQFATTQPLGNYALVQVLKLVSRSGWHLVRTTCTPAVMP